MSDLKSMGKAAIINKLISMFGERYLEIGCARDVNFNQIISGDKVGVDPRAGGTHRMESDQYFRDCNREFDVVFVDGLHFAEQAARNVKNAIEVTKAKAVVMHDVWPLEERHQTRERQCAAWCGDVWKAYLMICAKGEFDARCVPQGFGMGIILNRPPTMEPIKLKKPIHEHTWEDYLAHRDEWFRPMAYPKFLIPWLNGEKG